MTVTDRQIRVAGLIACGADTATVAGELGIAYSTAKGQIKKLRAQLGASTMLEIPDAVRALGISLPACTDEWVDGGSDEERPPVCSHCGGEFDSTIDGTLCDDCDEEDDDGTIRV